MLIFLDLETTGLESDDRVISIGLIYEDTLHYERISPAKKKIQIDAMVVHHITNEMLKDAPIFENSNTKVLLDSINTKSNTIISHNVGFDSMMLTREGFEFKGEYIDTLRCTRHLLKENDSHALQYLRYDLELYKQEQVYFKNNGVTIQPHHALSDALHVKMLYNYLLGLSDEKTLKLLSNQRVLIEKFSFGKHKDKYIEEVSMNDRGYLEWMLHTMSDLDEDLRYSIEYYLGGHF